MTATARPIVPSASVLRPLLAAGLLLAAATATARERPAEFAQLAEPAGLGRLLRPSGERAAPLVIILPDAIGEDGRADLYAEALAARGIASLALGLGEDLDHKPSPVDPAASPDALPPALDWASGAGFGVSSLGVMGFGLGGRAALRAAEGRPTVALYPGCQDLALPGEGPVLILQGADAAADCDTLPARPGIRLRLLPGVGHAWDAPGAIWPSPGPVLADPAGGAPLRSRFDAEAMRAAAEMVADWFDARLLPPTQAAAR